MQEHEYKIIEVTFLGKYGGKSTKCIMFKTLGPVVQNLMKL